MALRICACCKEETGVGKGDRHGNIWCPGCRTSCSLLLPCRKPPASILTMARNCLECGQSVLVRWPDGKPPASCEEHD